MSDNDVLPRFVDRFAPTVSPQADEDDAEENAGAFGYLRGSRERSHFLELRFKDGRIWAPPYAQLDLVELHPPNEIVLTFAEQKVQIRGQGLHLRSASGKALLDAILRCRATWIQESSRATVLEAQSGTIIESIQLI